ncbi:PorP/SprF family type IX secretion system membrane protein [Lewinella sp. JB7]|uniref:PorP/SprF family type IX secretion system membrane protein n=1 Tax=Lewinella sp. JB7 TaxID=2962887 RepID=UPI0020C9F74F|nr:PorP/SprF family type IX secretion system membrane protein [Lewinella sp. JB7]
MLFVVIACSCVRAQDARFSQLSTTPMLNNPALTGVMNGTLRLSVNYQSLYTSVQNAEGYQSVAAAVELRRPVGRVNYVGIGVQLQHDRAGSTDFVRSVGALSASYQQQLHSGGRGGRYSHYLSGGVQVGVGQRGFDINKLWFSEQYFVDPGTRAAYVDRNLATGEAFSGIGGQLYPDVSTGLTWFATFGDRAGAYFGGAVYHLTRPNVSPLPEYTDLLARRYVAYGGGELPLGRGYLSLLPAARVMLQGPSRSAMAGGSLRYTERAWREVALRVGTYTQITNVHESTTGLGALVVLVGLETEDLQLGLSYDITTSGLREVNSRRGGFELSIIYTRGEAVGQKVRCPTF